MVKVVATTPGDADEEGGDDGFDGWGKLILQQPLMTGLAEGEGSSCSNLQQRVQRRGKAHLATAMDGMAVETGGVVSKALSVLVAIVRRCRWG